MADNLYSDVQVGALIRRLNAMCVASHEKHDTTTASRAAELSRAVGDALALSGLDSDRSDEDLLPRERKALAWLCSDEAAVLLAGEARRVVSERFGTDVEESFSSQFLEGS